MCRAEAWSLLPAECDSHGVGAEPLSTQVRGRGGGKRGPGLSHPVAGQARKLSGQPCVCVNFFLSKNHFYLFVVNATQQKEEQLPTILAPGIAIY